MSSISFLSKNYKSLSELSETLNEAVILLQKLHLLNQSKSSVSDIEAEGLNVNEETATSYVITFLNEVQNLVIKGGSEFGIPHVLRDSFQVAVRTEPYLLEDIKALITQLREKRKLQRRDFELLEKLQGLIDSDRQRVFRKLRSRRL